MGIFSRFKDRTEKPLVAKPYVGHGRHDTVELLGTEASEFLANLGLLQSSQDSLFKNQKATQRDAGPNANANGAHLPPQVQNQAFSSRNPSPIRTPLSPPGRQVSPNRTNGQPQRRHPASVPAPIAAVSPDVDRVGQDAPKMPDPARSRQPVSTYANPTLAFKEPNETEYSSTESESESDALGGEDQKHPYYQQWKQYYAAMALYQTMVSHKKPSLSSRHSMFSGTPAPGTPVAPKNDQYMQFYQNSAHSSNGLIQNSRRSTIRSNRSVSVPLLILQADPQTQPRSVLATQPTIPPPGPTLPETEEPTIQNRPAPVDLPKPPRLFQHRLLALMRGRSLARGLSRLRVESDGQISDYDQFLHDDTEVGLDADATVQQDEATKYGVLNKTGAEMELVQEAEPVLTPDLVQGAPNTPQSASTPGDAEGDALNKEELAGIAYYLQEPEAPAFYDGIHPAPADLNRQKSTASTASYTLIQSENNFLVGRTPSRVAAQPEKKKHVRPHFVPPMAGPPPPIFNQGPPMFPQGPQNAHANFPRPPSMNDLSHKRSQSWDNTSNIDSVYHFQQMQHQMQQQIQQLQQMQAQMGLSPRYQSPQQTWSTDATINLKVEEFVALRQAIAQGNKSMEFRLKWTKMLMTAVNYKVYAYVNIRGDPTPSEQAVQNKQLFIKSAMTHLQKILREADTRPGHHNYDMRVFAEVCYLQGCLLMHGFVEKYNQDFGVERDDEEAEHYFHKSLEFYPGFYKSHFRLGQLFDQTHTEENFDKALQHYNDSARMGYNRAIYQVALILFSVPKVRLIKYFKYLVNLSEIDLDSKHIKLTDEDRDELEEIVGLASYQLGKIYEGIYPGDLTAEDEFVKASLELAPLNYARSLSYYNRAAKLHCLQAQVKLGHIYENGDLNRNPNPAKSVLWFIKASTSPLKFKRHPEAILGISRWFIVGTNGQSKHIPYPDPQRAVMWCERACKEFSFPEAFFAMGNFAEQGLASGSPQEWYAEAERLGFVVQE